MEPKLPEKVLKTAEDIREMRIRGAGRIARAAVEALIQVSKASKAGDVDTLLQEMNYAASLLLKTRPTAVSLPNGIRYVMYRLNRAAESGLGVDGLKAVVEEAGREFIRNSKMAVRRIAEIGAGLIMDGDVILTHCHSTAAVSIIKRAWSQGKRIRVYATETRPRFQGRITAGILRRHGVPVTLIVDGAARFFMREVDKVLVGADAIAANGAVVNKIGTSMVALAAHEAGRPFLVAAETYKFSPETMLGELVTIEERSPTEILPEDELKRLDVNVRNPAFDVTPPEYVDLIITEKGVIPPQAAIAILHREFGWITPKELYKYQTYTF